jgi:hypothetical protein
MRRAYQLKLRRTVKDNHARPTIKTYSFQYVTIILGMIFYCRLPNDIEYQVVKKKDFSLALEITDFLNFLRDYQGSYQL